ncbi:transcription factor GTE10-like isoform X2 [Telopea speciosissima]|uniref:transcription factor GTE10-like isoform X2 n=1 Tax=Telopea speciosissima TaxID=54955 RepID=UPI001CC682CE|nr:transcription factor GTE10-like isoform X2 [Telopea speciosissima]
MAPTVLVEYTGMKESKKYAQKVLVAMTGKTQKFSKGYSSGFVSDYRHAVETMGESDFGSSGRVDTEMTASDDSCAPKRKCISLNVDRCDGFGVPLQVLSVSKMSHSERKDLGMRLRADLEQVRVLQKRIALRCTNGVALSSSSDIRSCSDGQRRPPLENLPRSSEFSGQGKKRVPPAVNGPHLKRGISGRFESVNRGAPPSTSNVMLMKQCETLLKRLMSHQFSWVFNTPVDADKLNIPDYFQVIKHPMDLGTIKRKIASGAYSSPLDFVADVRLTFSNAMTYNPPKNDFHIMADTLRNFFEKRWEPIEKKFSSTDLQTAPVKSSVPREIEPAKPMLPSKKRKISTTSHNVKTEPVKRIMTDEEKHKLSRELESLLGEMPEHIVDFLRGHSFNGGQTGEDEIEVDIDALSHDTLFTLRKLLDDYLQEKQMNQAKAEPCEMEILNESGLSNSSMPCKGNEPVDEDVDIGGNDPPVSSYPPVEIEKDTAHKNSKCSSSSSSSSESGSSSSDSDSGSSSGSESEGAKASSPVNATKENLDCGADIDKRRSELVDPHDGNQSVSGLDQVEQNPQTRPVSLDADCPQEGESAPSERQVSPEKLYRAALLRSRFADTILKAREKALDQVEKGDPEKLRREREELERQQREEKARLQAEAKAAEDARRQAEAEAAAEAKRRRELEREAARQALQKMEKTVEINENCHFLEDLEMLRVAPTEHLPSSVDETSPDHSQDVIGSFKLRGSSNPLEQLGLYMKMDDDDEEEGEPESVPDPDPNPNPDINTNMVNDVEEGEID